MSELADHKRAKIQFGPGSRDEVWRLINKVAELRLQEQERQIRQMAFLPPGVATEKMSAPKLVMDLLEKEKVRLEKELAS